MTILLTGCSDCHISPFKNFLSIQRLKPPGNNFSSVKARNNFSSVNLPPMSPFTHSLGGNKT